MKEREGRECLELGRRVGGKSQNLESSHHDSVAELENFIILTGWLLRLFICLNYAKILLWVQQPDKPSLPLPPADSHKRSFDVVRSH